VRLTLATWNINSVRLRIDLVARFLREQAPHVLCLQETKCPDSEFPLAALHKLGYPYAAINGQKGYHGVAIASKFPLTIIDRRSFCEKGDARHIAVTLTPGGARGRAIALHNFYVPAGGDEPDPVANPKFAHKLAFLDEMVDWMATERIGGSGAIIAGDLNIAPLETDVWNHKALLRVVSHTPVEVEKAQSGARGGAMGRCASPLRAAGGKTLHVVELSRAGLAKVGQRPAARPCLGQP
jgi:exodeoxyribonuclease-3